MALKKQLQSKNTEIIDLKTSFNLLKKKLTDTNDTNAEANTTPKTLNPGAVQKHDDR